MPSTCRPWLDEQIVNNNSKLLYCAVVTSEDKQWEGDASDEEDAPMRERRLAQAAITELNREKEEQKVAPSQCCWLLFCGQWQSHQTFWAVCCTDTRTANLLQSICRMIGGYPAYATKRCLQSRPAWATQIWTNLEHERRNDSIDRPVPSAGKKGGIQSQEESQKAGERPPNVHCCRPHRAARGACRSG